jgi:uncharacterized ion transporter superfamily protein YfcC
MKFKFPSPYTVLMLVIVLAAIATWLLPAGTYNTINYNADREVFELVTPDGTKEMEASQQTLDELNININLDKFTSGTLTRPLSVPDTYQTIESSPQGFIDVFMAPILGMYDVIDIILLVLMIGGFIGVFNHSGALDEGVAYLAGKLKGREVILIIVVTTLMAIGGTTYGLAEETLAFYPILVPVFLAAGYDRMVPLAVIVIGAHIGGMASTTNPFSTIIASDTAGIDWTIGLSSRLGMLLIGVVACIYYINRYAKRVKADPNYSLLKGSSQGENPFSAVHIDRSVSKLPLKTTFLLILFGGTFLVMIFGVALQGWWLEEMTVLFLISSILMGFLQGINERKFVSEFTRGAKDLLGVCFIIGIARGVTVIMNEGNISDTILFHAVQLVEGTSGFVFLPALMSVFFVLAFFISSSSGLAVVTMPIMSSLSQMIGVPVEEIINSYQFGMGLMFFISPTSILLPSLAMVNVDYDTWIKFIWPLMLILAGIAIVILWLGLLF